MRKFLWFYSGQRLKLLLYQWYVALLFVLFFIYFLYTVKLFYKTLQGKWLNNRIDLDSHGEVLRIGAPKLKYDGTFNKSKETSSLSSDHHQMSYYLLKNGIELRSYILKTASEESRESLILRTKLIDRAPVPYNPSLDLVALDIKDIPTVLRMISESWSNKSSSNYISAMSLAEKLIEYQNIRKVI